MGDIMFSEVHWLVGHWLDFRPVADDCQLAEEFRLGLEALGCQCEVLGSGTRRRKTGEGFIFQLCSSDG